MKRHSSESEPDRPSTSGVSGIPSQVSGGGNSSTSGMAHEKTQSKRMGKRPGRKPSKIDQKAKLERSRQSARECRARKKLRYQYLEELVASREKAVFSLRDELEMYKRWCCDLDQGNLPDGLMRLLVQEEIHKTRNPQSSSSSLESSPTASPATQERESSGSQTNISRYSVPLARRSKGEHSRQLSSQPSVNMSGPQTLTSMHKGSRSFEEASRSSFSSLASSTTSVYRSGSVPNLASSTTAAGSTTLAYKNFDSDSSSLNSTGFVPQMTVHGCSAIGDVDTVGNIPTLILHNSPPSGVSKQDARWPWSSSKVPVCVAPDITCTDTPARMLSSASTSCGKGVFSGGSPVYRGPSFTRTSGSYTVVRHDPPPYLQPPRGGADSARKPPQATATRYSSSSATITSSSSSSQQNSPFSSSMSTYSSQPFPAVRDRRAGVTSSSSSTVVQNAAPECSGSELSASISVPLPHWYTFLDDLESAATFSARQGAFSDGGTPGSSRTWSGPGTPSSVDSTYSQAVQQQQPAGRGTDGNIPNIVSDLLKDSSPS